MELANWPSDLIWLLFFTSPVHDEGDLRAWGSNRGPPTQEADAGKLAKSNVMKRSSKLMRWLQLMISKYQTKFMRLKINRRAGLAVKSLVIVSF